MFVRTDAAQDLEAGGLGWILQREHCPHMAAQLSAPLAQDLGQMVAAEVGRDGQSVEYNV